MPQINLKLFANLSHFMPGDAVRNEVVYECDNDNSINSILQGLNVPLENCHLVIVNGVFIPAEQRDSHILADGDTLAVWPPVAGG